jgi:hypothetical protein
MSKRPNPSPDCTFRCTYKYINYQTLINIIASLPLKFPGVMMFDVSIEGSIDEDASDVNFIFDVNTLEIDYASLAKFITSFKELPYNIYNVTIMSCGKYENKKQKNDIKSNNKTEAGSGFDTAHTNFNPLGFYPNNTNNALAKPFGFEHNTNPNYNPFAIPFGFDPINTNNAPAAQSTPKLFFDAKYTNNNSNEPKPIGRFVWSQEPKNTQKYNAFGPLAEHELKKYLNEKEDNDEEEEEDSH